MSCVPEAYDSVDVVYDELVSRVNMNIPDDLLARLDARAATERRDRTSAITWAVELWLATPSQLPSAPTSTTAEQDPR